MKKFLLSIATAFVATFAISAQDSYKLVTSVDELGESAECIIASSSRKLALGTTQNTNNRAGVNVTITNGEITPGTDVAILTVAKSGTDYTFYVTNGESTGYLYAASSSKNYLKTQETAVPATVSIAASGDATIKFTGSYTRNLLKCNDSSNLFSCYASGQSAVQLYKKVATGPVDYTPDFQNVELMVGDTHTLNLGAKHPAEMIFDSSDKSVATISEEGVISAAKEGSTTITCMWDADDNFNAGEAEFTVTVTPKVKVVYAPDFQNVTITEGSTLALELGENHPVILFESSNENVATIDDNGVITALTVGETTISCLWGDADYEDGDAEFTVTVTEAPLEVTFDFSQRGFSNQQVISTVTEGIVTLSFDKGSNTNTPKYFTNNKDVRLYGGGSLTITVPAGYYITNIESTYYNTTNDLSADSGTFNSDFTTWTANTETPSVKFTESGTSGNRSWTKIVVKYAKAEAPECPYTEEELTPIFSRSTVSFDENNQAKIEIPNNDLDGVKIYYKHVPAATENEVNLMSVDHADFTEATHNVDNGTHDFTINGAGQVTYYGYHEATDTKGVERTFKVLENGTTGVEGVEVDGVDAEVEYFNLQGVRVENPAAGGLYIRKQGSKVTKVIL